MANYLQIILLICTVVNLSLQTGEEKCLLPARIKISDDKLTQLVNDIFTKEHLSLVELTTILQLHQFTLEDAITICNEKQKTPQTVFTVDNLEYLLGALKLDFNDFQNEFVVKLKLDTKTFAQVIQIFGIDQTTYFMTVTTHGYIYDILRKGSFTYQNMVLALQTVNLSVDDVFVLFREIVVEQSALLSISDFLQLVLEIGIDLPPVISDVYEEVFEVINENFPVVITGNDQIVVLEEVLDRILDLTVVDKNNFQVWINGIDVTLKYNKKIGADIVLLTILSGKVVPSGFTFTGIVGDYSKISTTAGGYYVVINKQGTVITETLQYQNGFIKNTNTLFIQGSPVFCQGKLYGLANQETGTNGISFEIFYGHSNFDNINIIIPVVIIVFVLVSLAIACIVIL